MRALTSGEKADPLRKCRWILDGIITKARASAFPSPSTMRPPRSRPFSRVNSMHSRPGLIRSILTELMPRFESGVLKPMPHRVLPVQRIGEALRYVSQTQRVGKVVVAISPEQIKASCVPAAEIGSEATYLITGGLGALGLQVARWLPFTQITPRWATAPSSTGGGGDSSPEPSNPVEMTPGMVVFCHMILFDSERELAMTLGRTSLVTEGPAEVLSKAPLDLFSV